jgi:hypothetical protein
VRAPSHTWVLHLPPEKKPPIRVVPVQWGDCGRTGEGPVPKSLAPTLMPHVVTGNPHNVTAQGRITIALLRRFSTSRASTQVARDAH